MNEKTKMMINEGILLWAFGCAVNHEDAAAFVLALSSAVYTLHIFSFEKVAARLPVSLAVIDLSLIIAHMTGLSHIIPAVGAVTGANCFYAVMSLDHSERLMDEAVKWFGGILLVYTALTFILPSDQFAFGQLLTLILLIFAPMMLVYAVRVFMQNDEKTYHGRKFTNELE